MKRLTFTMALLLTATSVWAQDYSTPEGNPDAPAGPGRGMARISLINGDVSVRRGDSGDVTAAVINAPLGSGDTLLTSSAARAELQFDATSLVRIAANSEVHMGDLEYHRNQIQVAIGLVTFTVLPNSESQNEIDTPSVAVHPRQPGAYRILVKDDGSVEITVRAGAADVTTSRGSQVLNENQTMMVRGSADDPEFQIVDAIQQDDWDRWNAERDQQFMQSASRRYVNPDVYGAQDLDQYGRWVDDGSYGNVWAPNVGPDWSPYSDGRWVWADDYGWTWVGYEPWGWAPYHYGRWYRASFGWAWWPGPISGPCYWSPALVGFFGWGGHVGFGFGFANVGWVPLAPFEPFHRWWGPGYGWRGGYGGFHNTVIVNNFNVYNTYRNARVYGGARGIPAGDFGRGRMRFAAVNGGEIRNAGFVRGALPVTPGRESLRFSNRTVNMSSFRQGRSTQFFTRSGVAPASRFRGASFEQQRQAMSRTRPTFSSGGLNSGAGNFGATQRQAGQFGASNNGTFSRGRMESPNANRSRGGWNEFGGSRTAQQPGAAANQSRGWGRYGGGSGSAPQPAYRGNSNASPNQSRGWNRYGGAVNGTPQPAYRGNSNATPNESRGWNRFGGGGSTAAPGYGSQPRVGAQPRGGAQPRYGSQPGYGSQPRYSEPSSRGYYGSPNGGGVRISPSIVSPRSQEPSPRNYGGYGGGGYGMGSYNRGNYSRPSYSQPSYSAPPRPSYSAPRPSYSAPPRMSAPRNYGGGNFGGGRSPSFSAPRSEPRFSAPPRAPSGGYQGGGGGGFRGGSGSGGVNRGGGGGHPGGGGGRHR